MTDVETLLAIEGIKKTKATYWYAMDTKQWDLLASTFTKDAIADYRGGRDFAHRPDIADARQAVAAGHPAVMQGREAIGRWMENVVGSWKTVHHGHAPIIDITGPDSGTAIWPIFDYCDDGKDACKGYGHYHDTYRFEDGQWRVDSLFFIRMRLDGAAPGNPDSLAA